MSGGTTERVGFRDVLAVAEFRALWGAQVLSLLGDQLARVALAVLTYTLTNSALYTGLVYALGFLPAVIGGPLLGGLADRLPRRTLMISCDVARAVLVVGMAKFGEHLSVLLTLLVVVELLSAPFGAARAALLTDVLTGEHYLVGSAIGNVTGQSAQVMGFALGGGLVAATGTTWTLLIDAATFVASALLLRLAVRARPAPFPTLKVSSSRPFAPALATARLVADNPRLRGLVLLALLSGSYVVPEGLAAPYAARIGGEAGTVGLLMAAQPAGATIGAVLLARFVPAARRLPLLLPLAALSCAPLLGFALQPGAVVTVTLLAVSGVGTAYQLVANAAFVSSVPAAHRGQAFGLVQSGILGVQGIGFLLAGAAADHVSPATVVAYAGGLGLVGVAALASSSRRALA